MAVYLLLISVGMLFMELLTTLNWLQCIISKYASQCQNCHFLRGYEVPTLVSKIFMKHVHMNQKSMYIGIYKRFIIQI